MDCEMKCVKMLLFVFNFLFWALGIVLLVVGITSRTSAGSWKELMEESLILNAANILIAAGAIVALIGFLGCCGAMKESRCLLLSFAISIILIFILQLAGGIYAYTKKDSIQSELGKGLDLIVNDYGKNSKTAEKEFNKAVDWFQQNVKCCGVSEPQSWENKQSYWVKDLKKTGVPDSCCIKEAKDCGKAPVSTLLSQKKIFPKGCLPTGKQYAKDKIFLVGGVLIGIGVIQLLGILFSCCLSRAIAADNK